jgi:hypothetical protein
MYSNAVLKLQWCYSICTETKEHLSYSLTYLITPSQNFVEVWWQSPFWSTSLGKWCTSYSALPTWKHAADCWSLWNLPWSFLFLVGKAQKSPGVRSELNSVFSLEKLNSLFSLEKVDKWNPIRTSTIQSRSHPMWFLGFSNQEKGMPRQEISKWSTVCSMFSRSRWSIVRSASLVKGGTLKKRLSPHLHDILTWSNKASPWTFHTALVYVTANYSI